MQSVNCLAVLLVCVSCVINAEDMDTCTEQVGNTDLIVFSYDRPMQLEACLRSTVEYVRGINQIYVIYRASNERFAAAYETVAESYSSIHFLQQRAPFDDFKHMTMHCLQASSAPYILFAVDDDIVTGDVDLWQCAQMLERTGAYGFFLRTGINLSICYTILVTRDCPQKVPAHTYIADDVITWKFANAQHDWAYPNNVDMTLYRKAGVINTFKSFNFKNPNQLEGSWAGRYGRSVMQRFGLSFEYSKMVNIPVNAVHIGNRHMHSWSTAELLEFFEYGNRIDIRPLLGIKNSSAHMEYALQFIDELCI